MAFTDEEIVEIKKRHSLPEEVTASDIRVLYADTSISDEQKQTIFVTDSPKVRSTKHGGKFEVVIHDPEATINDAANAVYTEYTGGGE